MTERNDKFELAGDLMDGMAKISEFAGLPLRETYYLAVAGRLPGVFKDGRKWLGLKSVMVKGLRARAEAGANPAASVTQSGEAGLSDA